LLGRLLVDVAGPDAYNKAANLNEAAITESCCMSPETENVIRRALQLPREARALIAEKLLESLDLEEPFEVSDAWKEEIARRCRELDDGTAELIPGDDVLKEAAKELRG
jgi:putative addiction module component (TIGR02574 family)